MSDDQGNGDRRREPVRFLVFSASRRAGSLNTRLADLARTIFEAKGGTVDHASMADFDCPSFDSDVEQADGLPPGAVELCRRLSASDGLVIASPEYNASMPGILKNAIDWTSRCRPQPFAEKHALLLSASPAMIGGNRGLWALRIPLEHLGTRVYPEMFSLAQANDAWGDDGTLRVAELQERFEETIGGFIDLVEASKHYPCARARWIEFLGEPPSVIDRVE
jgi:chromate reductase